MFAECIRYASRLIHSARVIDGQICYDIKDANTVYELFYTRFSLHKNIYNHKTSVYNLTCIHFYADISIARAIEYMIMDVLLIAQKHMKFAEYIDIPEKYLHLTDDLFHRINMTESEVSLYDSSFRTSHLIIALGTCTSTQDHRPYPEA